MNITVITINYNNLQGLKKTMQSVLEQTYVNIEYIVIDGGSNDGSKAYIESFKQSLGYWVSERDSGIYNAMNKGIDKSNGDYLLFLNSGDTLNDKFTLRDISIYVEEGFDIYYGNLKLLYGDKIKLKTFPDKLSFSYFVNKGYLPHPATFIKRSLFKSVHLYNENFKIIADWDFLICAICKHNATYKYINRVVSVFDKGGISNNPKFYDLRKEEAEQSLRSNFPLFLEDSKRLIAFDKKFKKKRFKILDALEANTRARKLNTFWFALMAKLFLPKS